MNWLPSIFPSGIGSAQNNTSQANQLNPAQQSALIAAQQQAIGQQNAQNIGVGISSSGNISANQIWGTTGTIPYNNNGINWIYPQIDRTSPQTWEAIIGYLLYEHNIPKEKHEEFKGKNIEKLMAAFSSGDFLTSIEQLRKEIPGWKFDSDVKSLLDN